MGRRSSTGKVVLDAARAALRGLDEPAPGAGPAAGPPPERLRSLYDCLREVAEYRSARGIRHPARDRPDGGRGGEAGGRPGEGVTAIAELARRLDQRQLAAVRAFQSPPRGCRVAPSKTCLHRILSELDPDALDGAVRRWAAPPACPWLRASGPLRAGRPRSQGRSRLMASRSP